MRKLRVSFSLLTLLIISQFANAQTFDSSLQDPGLDQINAKTIESGYNDLFEVVRFLTTNKIIVKFLKKEFPELTEVPEGSVNIVGEDLEKLKSVPEHVFVLALRQNREFYKFSQKLLADKQPNLRQYILDFKNRFAEDFRKRIVENKNMAHLRPLELKNPNIEFGGGIASARLFSSTPRLKKGKKLPQDNLVDVVIEFIDAAEEELVLNVFDFDLMEIAEALSNAAKRGVSIRIGMDKDLIHERDAVAKVYNKLDAVVGDLQEKGKCISCKIHAVDSVSLNHQKLIARDWSIPGKGAVLTSSGNFTKSGISKTGDMTDIVLNNMILDAENKSGKKVPKTVRENSLKLIKRFRDKNRNGKPGKKELDKFFKLAERISKKTPSLVQAIKEHRSEIEFILINSIPNANHMVVYQSDSFAQLVNHELTKTIDMELRGRSGEKGYPLSGIYKIRRNNGKGYVLVSFSPNGGYGEINSILSSLINHIDGKIKMMQFAFSSPKIAEALENAIFEEDRSVEAIGEGPFAMSYWSVFLRLSGIRKPSPQERKKKGTPNFFYENVDFKYHGHRNLEPIQNSLRVAPRAFGTHSVRFSKDQSVVLTSKLHHKLLIVGDKVSTPGTSHNFSKGALSNQEQIIIAVDENITEYMKTMYDYIYSETRPSQSVLNTAKKRNRFSKRAFKRKFGNSKLPAHVL